MDKVGSSSSSGSSRSRSRSSSSSIGGGSSQGQTYYSSSSPSMQSNISSTNGFKSDSCLSPSSSVTNLNSTPSLDQDSSSSPNPDPNLHRPHSAWTRSRPFNSSSSNSNSDDEEDLHPLPHPHSHSHLPHSSLLNASTPTLTRSKGYPDVGRLPGAPSTSIHHPIHLDPMDLSPSQPFLPHHELTNRERPNLENLMKASKNLQPLIDGLEMDLDHQDANDMPTHRRVDVGGVGVGQDGTKKVKVENEDLHIGNQSLNRSDPQPFSTPSAFSRNGRGGGGDLETRFATHVSMTPPASFGSQTHKESPFALNLKNNQKTVGSSRKLGGGTNASNLASAPRVNPNPPRLQNHSHHQSLSIPRSHAFSSLALLPQSHSEDAVVEEGEDLISSQSFDPVKTPIKTSKIVKNRSSSTASTFATNRSNPHFSPQKRLHGHVRSQSQGGSSLSGMKTSAGGIRRTFPLNHSLRKGNFSSVGEENPDEHQSEWTEKPMREHAGEVGEEGRTFAGSDPMSDGTGLGLDLGNGDGGIWNSSSHSRNASLNGDRMSSRSRAQTEGNHNSNSKIPISAVASRRGKAPAMIKVSSSSGSSCSSANSSRQSQPQLFSAKKDGMDLDDPSDSEEGEENSHPASPTPLVCDIAFPTSSSPFAFKRNGSGSGGKGLEDERMHQLQPGPQQKLVRKNPKIGIHSRTTSSNGGRSGAQHPSPPSFNLQAATPKSPSAPEFRGLGLCLGPSPSSSTSKTSKTSKHSVAALDQPTGPYQSKSLSAATGNGDSKSSPFKTPFKRRTASNASERPRNRALSSASATNSNSLLDFNIPRSNSASSASDERKREFGLDLDEKLKGSAKLFGFASPNRSASSGLNNAQSSSSKSFNDLHGRTTLLSYSAPRPTTKQSDLNLRKGPSSVNRSFPKESSNAIISNEAMISTPVKSNDNGKNLIHNSLLSSVKNGKEFDDSGIAMGNESPSVEAAIRNGLNFDPRKELSFQTERRLANRLGVSREVKDELSLSNSPINHSTLGKKSIGDFSSPAKPRPNSNFNSPISFSSSKANGPMVASGNSSTPLKKSGLIPSLQRQPRERSSLANETKLSNSNSNGSSIGEESDEGADYGLGRPKANRLRSGSGSNLLSIGRSSDLNSLEMARKVSTGSIGLGSCSSNSSSSGFSTPQNYKNVKPLQTAFMSTGLVSKRARMNTNDGVGNSSLGSIGAGGESNSNELPIPRPNFASALGLREVVAAAAQVSTTMNSGGTGVGPMPDTPVKKPVSTMMMMPNGGGVSKSLRTLHHNQSNSSLDSNFNHHGVHSPSAFNSTSNSSAESHSVESPQIPDSCDSPTLNLLSVNGGFPELGSSKEDSSSPPDDRTSGYNNVSGRILMNRISKGSPNELNHSQSPAKPFPSRQHLQRQDAFIGNVSNFTDSTPISPASPSIDISNAVLSSSPSSRHSGDDMIEDQVLTKGRSETSFKVNRLSPPIDQNSRAQSPLSFNHASRVDPALLNSQSKPLGSSTDSQSSSCKSSTTSSIGLRNQKSRSSDSPSSRAPKVRMNGKSVSPRPAKFFGPRPPLGLARKSSFGVSSEQAIQMALDGNTMNLAGSASFASPQLGNDGIPMTPTRNGATLKWFEAAQIVTTPSPSHRKTNGSLPRSHRTRQLATAVHQELNSSSTPAKGRSMEIIKHSTTSKFQTQFVVQSVLGRGEFSEAVKVSDKTQDGAVYAIKRMKRPFVGQKDRLRNLEEVDILRHLSSEGGNPNVISLVDAWEESGHLFIQTELCPLGTLSFFLEVYCGQVGNLDEPRLWKILTELSHGISYIHGKGVLHLDLKPANIFITEIGTLKIGDFGMATRWPLRDPEDILKGAAIVASDPRSAPKPTSASVSTAGAKRGRRNNMRISDREGDREYLAPEILEGKYSKAADMFSLGLIMLEAAGSVVLPDNGESWQKLRHDDFSEVDLSELSKPFISVVYRLLSSQPHQRPTVQELVSFPVLNAVRKRMARGLLHSELDQLPDFEINSIDNKGADCSFGNVSLGKIFESEQVHEKDRDGDETMRDGQDQADETNDSILGLSGIQRDQKIVLDVRGALIQETDEDFLTDVLSSINEIGNEDEVSTAAFLACSSPINQTSNSSPMDQSSSRLSPSQSHSHPKHNQSLSEGNVGSSAPRSSSSPANMSPDPNAMDLDEADQDDDGDDDEDEDEDEFFGSHQTIYSHNHSQAGSVP